VAHLISNFESPHTVAGGGSRSSVVNRAEFCGDSGGLDSRDVGGVALTIVELLVFSWRKVTVATRVVRTPGPLRDNRPVGSWSGRRRARFDLHPPEAKGSHCVTLGAPVFEYESGQLAALDWQRFVACVAML
jgi:hypothetical protein